jgi:hypothetical protein
VKQAKGQKFSVVKIPEWKDKLFRAVVNDIVSLGYRKNNFTNNRSMYTYFVEGTASC